MSTLLADIGGTNGRFALLEGGGEARPVSVALDGFPGIIAALAAFLGSRPPPQRAVLAVAGPVTGNRVRLTNRDWVVDGAGIAAALGIGRVRVVNDFEALAWSLPEFGPADLFPLGGGPPQAGAPLAVIGPGTGLGVGAFLPPDRVVPSEGGHAALAAYDAKSAAVIEAMRAVHGHVSAERLLSGMGIENIHAALGGDPALPAAAITVRAMAGEDARCREALDLFCALLGSVAGDLALIYGARGGVFIGGGICPRFPDFLAASAFRERFEAKGRLRPWVAAVPAWLIRRPDPAMPGLAALARQD